MACANIRLWQAVGDDGALTLAFTLIKDCPHFKCVFTGTQGQIFLMQKGNSVVRELKVELQG